MGAVFKLDVGVIVVALDWCVVRLKRFCVGAGALFDGRAFGGRGTGGGQTVVVVMGYRSLSTRILHSRTGDRTPRSGAGLNWSFILLRVDGFNDLIVGRLFVALSLFVNVRPFFVDYIAYVRGGVCCADFESIIFALRKWTVRCWVVFRDRDAGLVTGSAHPLIGLVAVRLYCSRW
ncbi:hypothetical protein KCP78_19050 [Salmonella enterica subsp. enterica]|nr:hypothetical protein KCP78_19050 [Salmonella enterica subsp. enterica]